MRRLRIKPRSVKLFSSLPFRRIYGKTTFQPSSILIKRKISSVVIPKTVSAWTKETIIGTIIGITMGGLALNKSMSQEYSPESILNKLEERKEDGDLGIIDCDEWTKIFNLVGKENHQIIDKIYRNFGSTAIYSVYRQYGEIPVQLSNYNKNMNASVGVYLEHIHCADKISDEALQKILHEKSIAWFSLTTEFGDRVFHHTSPYYRRYKYDENEMLKNITRITGFEVNSTFCKEDYVSNLRHSIAGISLYLNFFENNKEWSYKDGKYSSRDLSEWSINHLKSIAALQGRLQSMLVEELSTPHSCYD